MPPVHPVVGKFDQDPRVSFDKVAGKWQYEDDITGQEFEFNEHAKTWLPLIDENSLKAQQAAYSVAGVDEAKRTYDGPKSQTPANAVIARQQRIAKQKKRKVGEVDVTETTLGPASTGNGNATASSSGSTSTSASTSASTTKPDAPATAAPAPTIAPKRTAVWVSNLPPNTTTEMLASVFSKAGVLLIGDGGEPRIKLYYDDDGDFKGEALVMYFKEGSVTLAVTLLDDTELELGSGFGNMHVKVAEYEKSSQKTNEDKKAKKDEGENKGEKKRLTAEEKQRMTKRIKRMQDKVTWHSDDEEDDDPLGPAGGPPKPGQNRFNRVVVLKGMFAPADIDKDPALLLELKEDVREECETMGQVTACTLFDKEEDGVMTVKFKDAAAAQACIAKLNGRFFDGRKIYAGIYAGKERYKRSNKGIDLEDQEKDERERLDNFAQWLVDDEGEQ